MHKALDHVSPLAVPVMLEIGREQVYGEAADELLAETEAELVKEAMQRAPLNERRAWIRSFVRRRQCSAGKPGAPACRP